MSDLVSTDSQKTFMGVSGTTDDTLIGSLLTMVEDAFERACGRTDRPFQAAENNRIEVRDGVESDTIYLDYPIEYVSSITLGLDADDPDETLDPDDLSVVVWGAGKRMLRRVDGGTFGSCYPRYITIEYKTQADLPEIAKLAVQRATALLYRQRGSEDAVGHNEAIGDYSRTLGSIDEDGFWKLAVQCCWEPVLV